MTFLRIISTTALCLGFAHSAQTRVILYDKAKETLTVSFGTETILRFPQEVKTITEANRFEIRPVNTEEPDYSILLVKPRMSEGASDVTFILADGSMIRTQLTIANRPNLKKDSVYDFKPRDTLDNVNPNLSDKQDPMTISELDLMRGMIRGDQVSGFDRTRHSQTIDLNSSNIQATLIKSYLGRDVNGFVYLLKTDNKTSRFEVDPSTLAIGQPNLAVLAQIDRTKIGGPTPEERQAYLRIVAKPGASSHRVVLPVAIGSDKEPAGAKP